MNPLKLRTTFFTVIAMAAAQASLAAVPCSWGGPPCGRNGWQAAPTAKALPQTAAVQAPGGIGWYREPPSGRNGWRPAPTSKALPQSAAVQAPAGSGWYEPPCGRNGWQPSVVPKPMPASAAGQGRLHRGNGL